MQGRGREQAERDGRHVLLREREECRGDGQSGDVLLREELGPFELWEKAIINATSLMILAVTGTRRDGAMQCSNNEVKLELVTAAVKRSNLSYSHNSISLALL